MTNMRLILFNGKIRISDNNFKSAVLIENDLIKAVGSDSEILHLQDADTDLINLEGRLALPGFNDSHMHFLNVGYYYSQLNLGVTQSIEEALILGRQFIKDNSVEPGQWIQCYGWNDDNWQEKRFINRYDLDRISTDYPIVAVRVCTHVLSANSKALELLGVENVAPDGILREFLPRLYEFLPEPTIPEIKEMILKVGNVAASKGLTSVQSDDLESIPGNNYRNIIKAYAELAEKDELPVRVYEQCRLYNVDDFARFTEAGFHTGMGKDIFRLGPLKTFCDGSLGARTAWLKEDYSDDPGNRGLCIYDNSATLNDLVIAAHKAGMSVAIHCIGDAAAEQAISAIENAIKELPETKTRHGIVHAQILSEDLIKRIKAANIIAYIQPVFLEYDAKIAELRIGPERLENSYHYRKMYDMGIVLPFGTDSPVEDFNPMKNLYCATTGKDFDGKPKDGWHKEKLLTLDEAIYCYTQYSAYASFDENKKGKIAPGYLADITVLEEDVFDMSPDLLKDVRVHMTIMGGKLRYINK
ncbi:MAG: amidohydrolase [Anaerovoracaceae bacterium]